MVSRLVPVAGTAALFLAVLLTPIGAEEPTRNPSEQEVVAHVRRCLDTYAGRERVPAGDPLAELTRLVHLDAGRLHLADGNLTWICRRKRKLTRSEQRAVVEKLETLLGRMLAEEPVGNTGQPLLSRAAAQRLVEHSTLAVAWQSSLRALTNEDVHAAVVRYLKDLEKQDRAGEALRALEKKVHVDPDTIGFADGEIFWTLERVGEWPREEVAVRRDKARFKKLVQDAHLEEGLRAALTEFPQTHDGLPLLDEEDAATLKVRVFPPDPFGGGLTEKAALIINRIRPASSRGAEQRTLTRLHAVTPRSLKEEEINSIAGGDDAGNLDVPQLMIDAQGFSGGAVNALAFSPDGKWLAAGGDVVRIWDTDSGKLLYTLRGQREFGGVGGCTALTFSPDGRQLLVAVAGFSTSLRVYDTADFSHIQQVFAGHDGHVDRIALSRDGHWLATAGVDNRVLIWDWPDHTLARAFAMERPIDYLGFPTRDPWLLAIDVQGDYAYWSAADGKPAGAQHRQALEALFDRSRWLHDGAPHPFALALDLDTPVQVCGGVGRSGQEHHYWCAIWSTNSKPVGLHYHSYYLTACAFSPDHHLVASADALGEVHLWGAEDSKSRFRFRAQSQPIYAVAFSDDGNHISFGRTPLHPPEWHRNHFGQLTHTFDLLKRTIGPDSPTEPPAAVLQQHGRTLAVREGQGISELVVQRDGQTESRLPFAGRMRTVPLCYTFLRGEEAGCADAVVLGSEDGGLSCFQPNNFLTRRHFIGHADRVWCLSQSRDGRYLCSGSGDGTFRIWGLKGGDGWGNLAVYADEDGTIYHVVPGTPTEKAGVRVGDRVVSIAETPLGQLTEDFAATGEWPWKPGETVPVELERGQKTVTLKVKLSNMGDVAQPLLSVFLAPDGREWVMWTPEGYYDASPQGDRFIGWQVNQGRDNAAQFYLAEQFREQFYRPDVIDQVLKLGDTKRAIEAANAALPRPPKPLDFPKDHQELSPPEVRILEPTPETHTGVPEITVRAEVFSTNEKPLTEVTILVNGTTGRSRNITRPSPTPAPGTVPEAEIQRISETHWVVVRKVALEPGDNEVQVVAATAMSHCTPVSVPVVYRRAVAPTNKPHLFVVSVGVSRYADSRFNLAYAHRDAEEFAAVWKAQQGDLYEDVQTRVLTNENATEQKIRDALDWLVKSAGPHDVAILFLSGHGVCDERNNYYLAPHDLDLQRLRATALPWGTIRQLAADLGCRFLLFADTCHSGAVLGVNGTAFDAVRHLSRDDVGAVVFAACPARAQSLEREDWGHGAFTRALLDTFASPNSDLDRPPDGYLSLTELEHNLDRRVRELTGNEQTPVVGKPPTITEFNVFRLPRP